MTANSQRNPPPLSSDRRILNISSFAPFRSSRENWMTTPNVNQTALLDSRHLMCLRVAKRCAIITTNSNCRFFRESGDFSLFSSAARQNQFSAESALEVRMRKVRRLSSSHTFVTVEFVDPRRGAVTWNWRSEPSGQHGLADSLPSGQTRTHARADNKTT